MVAFTRSEKAMIKARRVSGLASLGLAIVFTMAQDAHAFGKIVYDPTTLAKQVQEYKEEAKRWQEKVEQYKSTLGNASMMIKSPGFNMEMTLVERAPNEGVAERCPDPSGSGGGLVGSMFDMFKPDLNGNIFEQQQVVCMNIVLLQNKKYNELVLMVKEADKRKGEIDKMISDAANSNKPGEMQSSVIKAQELMGKSLAEMQYSLARIQAFDGMIESLTVDQQTLAKQALSGSQTSFSGLLGTVIQGVSLEAALQVARTRER